MNWFILALISITTVSISSLLQKVLMKDEKSDPFVYGFFFQLFCSILIFIFAFSKGFVMPPITNLGLNFFFEAILYAGFTIFLFKALKLIEASEVTILTTTSAFWTILVALLFLGESFSMIKLLGVLLILIAVIFVNQREKQLSFHFNKGSLYALLAALCFGLAFANDAYILQHKVDAVSYTAIAFLLPSIVIVLARPSILSNIKSFLKPALITKVGLLGLFYSISAITAYLAYQAGGNASQLAPISQSRVVLTVILAAFFLNERSHLLKKLFAAILVSIGVLLLR